MAAMIKNLRLPKLLFYPCNRSDITVIKGLLTFSADPVHAPTCAFTFPPPSVIADAFLRSTEISLDTPSSSMVTP